MEVPAGVPPLTMSTTTSSVYTTNTATAHHLHLYLHDFPLPPLPPLPPPSRYQHERVLRQQPKYTTLELDCRKTIDHHPQHHPFHSCKGCYCLSLKLETFLLPNLRLFSSSASLTFNASICFHSSFFFHNTLLLKFNSFDLFFLCLSLGTSLFLTLSFLLFFLIFF